MAPGFARLIDLPDRSLAARPPGEGDVAGITEMCRRSDHAEMGRTGTDEDDIAAVWRWPDFDRARDALVVTAGAGAAVGYAWVHRGREGGVTVDPSWRGRGIGRALLAWSVERATAQAADQTAAGAAPAAFELYAMSGNAAAARLLRAAGFEPTRVELLLRIDLVPPVPGPAWPAGITPRPFEVERDGRALHELLNDAFADLEGAAARPFEEWAQFTLRRSVFDPTLVLLAEAEPDAALAGAAVCFDFDGEGYVQYLAVARPWRRRGLGLALLRHSFAVFAERGITRVELTADAANATGATRLYQRAGMREVLRWDRWARRP
jgi:mycothiol synthase